MAERGCFREGCRELERKLKAQHEAHQWKAPDSESDALVTIPMAPTLHHRGNLPEEYDAAEMI